MAFTTTADNTHPPTTNAMDEPKMNVMLDHALEIATVKNPSQHEDRLHPEHMLLRMVIHRQDIRSLLNLRVC